MINLVLRKEQFIKGLVEHVDWGRERAEQHVMSFSPMFEIGDEIDLL
jgi:carbonic anhydrase